MKANTLNLKIPSIDLTGLKQQMAMLQEGRGRFLGGSRGADGAQYDSGTRLLDEHKYDEAIQASTGSSRAKVTGRTARFIGRPMR